MQSLNQSSGQTLAMGVESGGSGRSGRTSLENKQTYPLHPEMFVLIFNELGKSDQFACRLVSKEWCQLIDEASPIWQAILQQLHCDLPPAPSSKKEKVLEIYTRLKTKIFAFDSHKSKEKILKIYTRLKTKNFVSDSHKNKAEEDQKKLCEYYQKYFFQRCHHISQHPQKQLFRIKKEQVFYAMGTELVVVGELGQQLDILTPHQGQIIALEIKGNRLLTSGSNAKGQAEIKAWNIHDLSCAATIPTHFLARAFHIIDDRHFISGNEKGNVSLWEIHNQTASRLVTLKHRDTKKPVIFLHSFKEKETQVIIMRDAGSNLFFWSRNEKGAWTPKKVQDDSIMYKRTMCGIADLLFEGYEENGLIRSNGDLTAASKRIFNNYDDFLLGFAIDAIQWMQFDEGSLYVASSKEIHRLDFTSTGKKSIPKLENQKVTSIQRLENDLRQSPKSGIFGTDS